MRILFASNAPWTQTGYGNQTKLFIKFMKELGHEIAVACNYGLRGAMMDGDGVKFYPAGYDQLFPNDVIQAHADDFEADVIISLYDAWVINIAKLKTKWLAWVPVDHSPAPEAVVGALRKATRSIAYSEFGYDELKAAGVKNVNYIPHGVDTQVFTPLARHEARSRLGLKDESYIVGMVGTNKGTPSRKCIPQALQAFKMFKQSHKEALMYLHTEETGVHNGIRLKPILDSLDLGGDSLLLCDQYELARGGFNDEYMRDIYNACDVLLSPSMAEGFGIPIMEAQACGTPVIATRFSSMTELVDGAGGELIGEFDLWWSPQGAWQAMPHVQGIMHGLDRAYLSRQKDEARNRAKARARGMQYDFQTYVAPAWNELLQAVM